MCERAGEQRLFDLELVDELQGVEQVLAVRRRERRHVLLNAPRVCAHEQVQVLECGEAVEGERADAEHRVVGQVEFSEAGEALERVRAYLVDAIGRQSELAEIGELGEVRGREELDLVGRQIERDELVEAIEQLQMRRFVRLMCDLLLTLYQKGAA